MRIVGAEHERILADDPGNTVQVFIGFGGDEYAAGFKIFDRVFGFFLPGVVAPHLFNQERNPGGARFQECEAQIGDLLNAAELMMLLKPMTTGRIAL